MRKNIACIAFTIFTVLVLGINKLTAQEVSLTSIEPTYYLQGGHLQNISGRTLTKSGDKKGWYPKIGSRGFGFGLNTYPDSEINYVLNGKYSRFEAWVGIQPEEKKDVKKQADRKVIFQVFTDGNKIYDSGVMGDDTPAKKIDADISEIKELQLVVLNASSGDPNFHSNDSRANWAEPKLVATKSIPLAKEKTEVTYQVDNDNGIRLNLNSTGKITGLMIGEKTVALQGYTKLTQCREEELLRVINLSGGGIQFTRLVKNQSGNQCLVTDKFTPEPNSIRWEVDIYSDDNPWNAAVITSLKYPVTNDTRFWTSWSDPDMAGHGGWNKTVHQQWSDPLQTRKFTNSTRWYGGNPRVLYPTSGDIFSVPISTIIDPGKAKGLSIVQSPEDNLLYMKLITTADGTVEYQRRFHRLGASKHVRFTIDLVSHENDWRSGLNWMVKRYPKYFEPVNPKAYDLSGCGAYTGWDKELDTALLKKMAFKFNWKASFDFPYMGMFLPPVDKWQSFMTSAEATKDPWVTGSFIGAPTSIMELENSSRRMRNYGFHQLNYFNVTEFGFRVKGPEVVKKDLKEEDLWKDGNSFLYTKIADGILYDANGECYKTWGGAIVMDPGAEDYQNFLLKQAQRHIDHLPSSSGIGIDRMDWLVYFNTRADDGVTWYNNKPARSLFMSWRSIMDKMGPMMHNADKVIFGNPCAAMRLDVMQHLDGIYSEHNEVGTALNLSAFLGVRKPVVAWTWDDESLRPDPDYFFQRFLYMGVFPSAPLPENNHLILPSDFSHKWYLKYGPLFKAMMQRKWVLESNVINVVKGNVKANLFEVPDGYVIPVVMADPSINSASFELDIKKLGLSDNLIVEALLPGSNTPVAVKIDKRDGNSALLTTPLKDRCALVRIIKKEK